MKQNSDFFTAAALEEEPFAMLPGKTNLFDRAFPFKGHPGYRLAKPSYGASILEGLQKLPFSTSLVREDRAWS